MTLGSVTNIALGFAFQIVLARALGVSESADIYSLGTMVATLAATVFIGSAPSAIVPALSRQLASQGVYAWRVFVAPTVAVLLLSVVVAAVNLAMIPALSTTLSPEGQEQLVATTAISSIALPLSWTIAMAQSVLISEEMFGFVGFSGAVNGIGLLAFAAFAFMSGSDPTTIAWAFVGGYLLQTIFVVVTGLVRLIRKSGPVDSYESVLAPVLTLIIAAMVYKSQPIIERSLASAFEGGPAMFNYAGKLAQAVLMGSTLGLSVISLPSISRNIAAGANRDGWHVALRVSTLITAFSAPLVITGIVAAQDVVGAIYGFGSFEASELAMISTILSVLLVGVFFAAISGPTVNYLYATSRYRLVASVSITTTILSGLAAWVLSLTFGLQGIAVGTSLAFLVNFVVYTFVAGRHAASPWLPTGFRELLIMISVLVVGVTVDWLLPEPHDGDPLAVWLRLGAIGLATSAVSAAAYLVLRRRSEDPLLGSR